MKIKALVPFSNGTISMEQYEVRDVTDSLGNELISAGIAVEIGGGGLPSVTESDAGKVLAVDNSGVWGAQEFPILNNPNSIGTMLVSRTPVIDEPVVWYPENLRGLAPEELTQKITITGDGTSFSIDTDETTADDLSLSKYSQTKRTVVVYGFAEIDANVILIDDLKPTYQTGIMPLDSLGLSGRVGFIMVYPDSNSQNLGYSVSLYYWTESHI